LLTGTARSYLVIGFNKIISFQIHPSHLTSFLGVIPRQYLNKPYMVRN